MQTSGEEHFSQNSEQGKHFNCVKFQIKPESHPQARVEMFLDEFLRHVLQVALKESHSEQIGSEQRLQSEFRTQPLLQLLGQDSHELFE
jgi:hypothetical protein